MYKILLIYIYIYMCVCVCVCVCLCCAFFGLDNKIKLIIILHVLARISYSLKNALCLTLPEEGLLKPELVGECMP